jgi:5S rRNA maturation endonuclease (ribonuclease M5)
MSRREAAPWIDLAPHTGTIARALLGEPNKHLSTKAQLRFGNHGSVAVAIKGRSAGTWFDHEAGNGGGLLDLVVRERGGSKRDAMAWLKEALGIEVEASGRGKGSARPPRRMVATYDYSAADGELVFQVVRYAPKTFRQRRPNGNGGWDWKLGDAPPLPYRLPELSCAGANDIVIIVEGEKDADNLAKLGLTATCNPGGAGKWPDGFARYFDRRRVVILPDNDQAGRDHARDVAQKLAGKAAGIRVLELPDLSEKGDVSDWLADGHGVDELRALLVAAPDAATWLAARDAADRKPDQIDRLIEEARTDPGAPFEDEAIDFLATLKARDSAAYERARARLKAANVRITALDQEVERRKPTAKTVGAGAGEIEPWPDPADGGALMGELVAAIRRYAVLQSNTQAIAVALWAIHTHTIGTAEVAPRLLINSPVPECGKTVLVGTIARLVPRPEISSNISPAALFRTIEQVQPTILVDEADTFLPENDELRGLLNSGHTRTSAYTRRIEKVGEALVSTKFSTWAAICIAGIGKLHPSITSRSIVITMQRKLASQKVERLLSRGGKDLDALGRKTARWVEDHRAELATLADALPDLPEVLGNRAADNWIELVALADLIGGDWPALARRAAVEISGGREVDDESIGVQLLGDIKEVFEASKVEAIWTEDLLRHLHAMEERPWSEYGRQRKPITTRQLADLLRPFAIQSGSVRIGEITKKGYKLGSLAQTWLRYAGTAAQANATAKNRDFSSGTNDSVCRHENRPKATATAGCAAVPDEKAQGRAWHIPNHVEMSREADRERFGSDPEMDAPDDLEARSDEDDADDFREFDEWIRP